MQNSQVRILFFAGVLVAVFLGKSVAQTADTTHKRVLREDIGVVKKVTVMPYATISYNLQSGEAFPKSAGGIGYGFGISFDLTQDKQPLGFYFDFAYQDMRAHAQDGGIGRIAGHGDTAFSLPVTHYFAYVLLEAFLKLQSEKSNGYFLIGLSAGLATSSLTDREGGVSDGGPYSEFSDWNSTYVGSRLVGNKLRLDLRAGLGIKLGYISGHQLVLEARFGYPLTTAVSDWNDVSNSSVGSGGSWRVVTLQGNIGLRL